MKPTLFNTVQFYFTSIFTPGSLIHTEDGEWIRQEVAGEADT